MQVRKFEASSMKEALVMVKKELGPEAIILSAKDNQRGFGLAGGASVEVTAAISEKMLKKKQLAEKKMREQDLEKFQSIPAQQQKKFINKVYNRAVEEVKENRRSYTQRKYIDIHDEGEAPAKTPSLPPMPVRPAPVASPTSKGGHLELVSSQPPAPIVQASPAPQSDEVKNLKSEISRLKKMLAEFQSMPQSFISVHPGAEKGVSYEFSPVYEKLRSVGVDEDIALDLIAEAKKSLPQKEQRKKHLVDAWMAQKILKTTRVVEKTSDSMVHIFAGPSGQGKTSSLVKLASQMVVKESKRIALVTADTFKVGAADQLKIFAQILNVPFAVIKGPTDWAHIMRELQGYDHILMDFPNVALAEMRDIDLVRRLMPPENISRRMHLVLSATQKNKDVEEAARKFKLLQFDDVIFTRLDETTQHGVIYNFQRKVDVPLHSFGVGSRIPEDFEMASRERVLDLLFKLTKMNKTERGER